MTSATPKQSVTKILGVDINAITMQEAIDTIESWINNGEREYVTICTVHSLIEADRDPGLKTALNGAGLRTPDGMPLVWLSRKRGFPKVERVYGPDLMLALCARSGNTGARHFFYGGGPGVVTKLVDNLTAKFPDLNVAGAYSPGKLSVRQLEDHQVIDSINNADADIVWIGLGCPKQEWWAAQHRHLLKVPVIVAVGAAFDFHSGHVRQAPPWMQRLGLEWLFRLGQDPRRLWKRYVVGNSRFIWSLIRESARNGAAHLRSTPL